ncbi:unnamed protein product, partial [Ectocarpus sp. 12 AP-2014]
MISLIFLRVLARFHVVEIHGWSPQLLCLARMETFPHLRQSIAAGRAAPTEGPADSTVHMTIQ